MKRVVLIITSAILLFSFSVFAQRIQPRPIPKAQLVTIQDDASGSFLIFELNSGEYKFFRCADGLTLTGYGLVKETAEEYYTFEHIQPDRRLTFWCNLNTHEGKGFVETFARISLTGDRVPMSESIYDSYMGDSVTDCNKK